MSDDNARTEKVAASENDWVRARILKQDPPVEGSLLKIAERARDMAARSLGNQHLAYAVALQNLGLYYDAIENDDSRATEFFAQARAALNDNELPLADGFYWLGIFHLKSSTIHSERKVRLWRHLKSSAGCSASMICKSRTR